MSSERRKHPRSDFPVEAVAYTGNVVVRCRLENLSLGGAALSTKLEMNPGAFLRLHFTLASGTAIDTDAVIVRSMPSPGAHVWGVTFVGLPAHTTEILRKALQSPPKRVEKPPSSRPPLPSSPRASAPPGSRPPSRPPSAPASRRELHDLFKEALEQLDHDKKKR